MSARYLDCTEEVSLMGALPSDRKAWLASQVSKTDWWFSVDQDMRLEINRLAEFIVTNPLPSLHRRVMDFALPHCQCMMENMKKVLDDGVGFAVLDALPMDEYPVEVMVEIY